MTRLIAIEGVDGAGKSTLARALNNHINENTCYTSRYVKFPDMGSVTGECITQLQANPPTASLINNWDTLAILHTINKTSIHNIMSECWDFLIVDRYVSSSIVYTSGLNQQTLTETLWVRELNYDTCKLPVPFLQIFVDTPPDIAQTLLHKRGGLDEYDTNYQLQESVYHLFQELFMLESNWITTNHSPNITELFNIFCNTPILVKESAHV